MKFLKMKKQRFRFILGTWKSFITLKRLCLLFYKMNVKNFTFFIAFICTSYILSILGSSCAQIAVPSGGPRDTLPPVLQDAIPANGTINFKGNRITLNYDEYVQLLNLQDNLLVSPTPKIIPNVDYKFRAITIKIRDTLEPNTTYRIDLGNSIADINENNAIKHYSYVFSTGPYIDSLTFSGNVKLAETGKVDTTLLVFLYKDLDDSAVYKKKPRYITKVNTTGNFKFHNLPGGTYNVFALKDESGQKVYGGKDELFAFADSSINIQDTTSSIDLFAYSEEKPKPKGTTGPAPAEKKLKYTTSISGGRQDLLLPVTLEFNHKLKNIDSLKIELTDTLYNPLKSGSVDIDTTGKKVMVKNKWSENSDYRLIISKDFATDTLGNALAESDTIHFKTKKESDYGIIQFTFKNLEKFKNPVLQFVSNSEVVNSYPLTSTKLNIKLFNPGDYEIRILEDINKNGIWDPGNYHLKIQPEKVFAIPQKVNIRGDWENDKDFIL